MKYTMIVGALSEIGKCLLSAKSNMKYILTEKEESYNELLSFVNMNQIDADIFALDVSNIKNIQEVFDKINKKELQIEALVYIPGKNYLCEAISVTEEIWDDIINVNLKGCFFVMQEVGKNMICHETKGSIVNISSQHGVVGNINRAPYCSSKAGLLNLNKVLSLEWSKFGIRVNSVSPTFIIYEKNYDFLMSSYSKREYLKNIPLHSYCEPKDITNAIRFLLSEDSKMITGHNLVVDGGWTIK